MRPSYVAETGNKKKKTEWRNGKIPVIGKIRLKASAYV